jgi:hypothetical protein
MQIIVDIEDLTEDSVHQFSGFASDIGLPPVLPTVLAIPGVGNGQPFYLYFYEGGVAEYRQGNGCLNIKIFND